ncbi:MAG: sensor histidine kinase [Chloroflexota bacterium]|nr:MAG: sensor histidine kinase [Chloroflexota bacterium]
MKIKTQFNINMFSFALILVVIAVSLTLTSQRVKRLNQQEDIAWNIERSTWELSYLSNDYLLHHESQQRLRWEAKYASISEDLARLTPSTPDQRTLIDQIQANQSRLKTVFHDIANILESPDYTQNTADLSASDLAFIQTSWSRLEVQNQNLVFDASLLAHSLRDEIDRSNQTNIWLIFALVCIFGSSLLVNYALVHRRTLRGLADLQAGTRLIGSGRLDYAFKDTRDDEIGELSQAFNWMITNLREITASKADLEREIADRKRAEQALVESQTALKSYAEKLQRSNQELEQFAFVASHDLQEPLRKISVFGDLLGQKLKGKLSGEECDQLERMLNASQRMQGMISDLLELSRVTTQAKPFTQVDLLDTTKLVLSDLEFRLKQVGGKVEVGDLPTIEADPAQMQRLLINLISNSLKYHRDSVPPVVQITGKVASFNSGDMLMLTIKDNGIGFEPQYAERIFQPFARLHSRSKYEGTGMGLAICRKIIERHNGMISANSTLGEGSTFIITMPLRQGR